jgi:hypothetical protein
MYVQCKEAKARVILVTLTPKYSSDLTIIT